MSYLLHPSQRLVAATEAAICMRLTVYDTHELGMELLSYGPEVAVLAPAGLREWVREMHTASYS
ncbi:WCX domain-containing protein [Hymenobacter roseosalivarius]|nr:WYL domain-containing protein [Hymenobacter roseosalivarius]